MIKKCWMFAVNVLTASYILLRRVWLNMICKAFPFVAVRRFLSLDKFGMMIVVGSSAVVDDGSSCGSSLVQQQRSVFPAWF